MTARRPLTAGINTPEGVDPDTAHAFIKQDTHPAEVPKSEPLELNMLANTYDQQEASSTDLSAKRRWRKPKNKVIPIGLIPVTVRLRPEVAGALKRASLELQLHGEEVHTQQDLVEQCLEPWLRSEGFLTD